MRMIERRRGPRLALEANLKIAALDVLGAYQFDRYQPSQPRIPGSKHLAHAAFTQECFQSVGSQPDSWRGVGQREARAGLRRILGQQRLYFAPQFGIFSACRRKVRGPLVRRTLPGSLVDALDILPPGGSHNRLSKDSMLLHLSNRRISELRLCPLDLRGLIVT